MSWFKAMYKHGKYIKETLPSSCGGGGRVDFSGAKMRSDDGEDLYIIITSVNKESKAKAVDDSDSWN